MPQPEDLTLSEVFFYAQKAGYQAEVENEQ